MKRVLFLLFFAALAVFLTVGVGAETYEADGGSATVYAFPSEDCNRTVVVRCVDESGTLLKTVTCYTKRGESTLLYFGIYGYDTVGFQSDAGVWTTCKLGNLSQGQHCYCGVDVTYHFRTAMSQKQVNATVTMRKFEDAKVIVRHTKEVRYGYNWSACYYETVASYEYTLNSGTPFRSRAMTVAYTPPPAANAEREQHNLFALLSQAYEQIPTAPYLGKLIQADFASAKPLSEFSPDLCAKTVQSVLLREGAVSIRLQTGQEVTKEGFV